MICTDAWDATFAHLKAFVLFRTCCAPPVPPAPPHQKSVVGDWIYITHLKHLCRHLECSLLLITPVFFPHLHLQVLQMAGIEDCYTSSRGSRKTLGNFVKATFNALAKTYGFLTPGAWHPFACSSLCCRCVLRVCALLGSSVQTAQHALVHSADLC